MRILYISWWVFTLQVYPTATFEIATGPPVLNSPVFSLATFDEDLDRTNMNILTYATPVSIRPERLWVVGLYKETYSYKFFRKSGKAILQLLSQDHIPLVRLLGGSCGREVDKRDQCRRLGYEWIPLMDDDIQVLVLPDCCSYLCLEELQGSLIDGGSHDIAICRVARMWKGSDKSPLESRELRDLGIISEQGRIAD